MGKIVAAVATVHAPQLFDRPPTEDLKQLDADVAAMRVVGKVVEDSKPDAVIVIGSDHLETFFLSSVPTFAILSGEFSHAEFAGRKYELPIHQGLAEDLLDKLMAAGFDMGYSQDAVLGHAFAAVYEWVIEKRPIPVVPLFVNAYLPPLPSARRCAALGRRSRKSSRTVPRKSPSSPAAECLISREPGNTPSRTSISTTGPSPKWKREITKRSSI